MNIFFLRHGGGFVRKGSICIKLPGKHRHFFGHPRPSCSHQTHSPPRRLLFLWVPVDNTISLLPAITPYELICHRCLWPYPESCVFFPQSTMKASWRTCRYAKYSKCDSCIHRKNEKLSACLASCQTTVCFAPLSVNSSHVCLCSEVQDPCSANEAIPQRKPAQKDALC